MPKGGRKGGNAPKFTRQVPKFLQQYAALLGAERPDPTANDDHCYQSTAVEEGYDSESDKVVDQFLKERTARGDGVEAEYQRERKAKADAKRREEEAKRKPTAEEVRGTAAAVRRRPPAKSPLESAHTHVRSLAPSPGGGGGGGGGQGGVQSAREEERCGRGREEEEQWRRGRRGG